MTSRSKSSNDGMTLIEMLAVVAIIALIFAMGVPMVDRSIERARKTQCVSNLRQIMNATQQQFVDEGDTLPTRGVWDNFGEVAENLLPYVKNTPGVFDCPSYDLQRNSREKFPNSENWTDYEFNGLLGHIAGNSIQRYQHMVDNPAAAAYAWDLYYAEPDYRAHEGGMNVGYLDGHAAWLPEEDFGPLNTAEYPGTIDQTTFYRRGHRVDEIATNN